MSFGALRFCLFAGLFAVVVEPSEFTQVFGNLLTQRRLASVFGLSAINVYGCLVGCSDFNFLGNDGFPFGPTNGSICRGSTATKKMAFRAVALGNGTGLFI